MFKDRLARMSNNELLAITAKEIAKHAAVIAVSAVAFKVVVEIVARLPEPKKN